MLLYLVILYYVWSKCGFGAQIFGYLEGKIGDLGGIGPIGASQVLMRDSSWLFWIATEMGFGGGGNMM